MTVKRNPSREEPGQAGELREDRYVDGRDLTRWYTPAGRLLAASAQWVSQRLGPNATLLLTLIAGMAIAVICSITVVQIYVSVTDANGVAGLDQPLLDAAVSLRSPILETLATAYTTVGGIIGMPIVALTALLILSTRRRSWTPVILILAAGTGSSLMTITSKELFKRVRPPESTAVPPFEHTPSFPSGHALSAVVIAGVIAYLLILRQRSTHARVLTIAAAALFAVTMGLTRVLLGHHWFTDVLAGWTLGALWIALVITAHRLYLTVRKRDPATVGGSANTHADEPIASADGHRPEEPETGSTRQASHAPNLPTFERSGKQEHDS